MGIRFGVRIIWPVLLWQARTLRESLAFIDSTKAMQAQAYALEAVIEHGLREDFGPNIGEQIIAEMGRIQPTHADSEDTVDSRGAVFSSWTKAQRRRGLAGLIASFDPMYESMYPFWLQSETSELIAPSEYATWEDREWPDPKW